MSRNVKVVVNKKAVEELLKVTVVPDLERRGKAIQTAAGVEGHDIETHIGRTRARVTVRTATPRAMYGEAKYRKLTRSITAGQGD